MLPVMETPRVCRRPECQIGADRLPVIHGANGALFHARQQVLRDEASSARRSRS